MEITIRIPDQVWNEDPTYPKYFEQIQKMVDRMSVSHYKYGRIDDNAKLAEIDEMFCGRERMYMYDGKPEGFESRKPGDTGNVENLLDAANFCIIEAVYPKHKKAHFKAQSSAQSPGLQFLGSV